MTTRAAAHAAAADAAPAAQTPHPTPQLASADDGASNAPTAGAEIASHGALDASAYEPAPSISAYANAAAVAASTAVLTPASASSASGNARGNALASPSSPSPHVALALPPFRSKLHSSRPSSKFGTVNYSVDEMRRLNDKVRAVLPVASEEWLHVAYQFNYMRPESIPYRDVESLKRKFKKMYCARSGASGKLPAYAQDAKELRRLINKRGGERAQMMLQVMDHAQSDSQSEVDPQDAASGGGSDAAPSLAVDTAPSTVETTAATEPSIATAASVEAEMETAAGGEGTVDDTRDMAIRLRLMEDEYHRSTSGKRTTTDAMGQLYADSTVATSPSLGLLASADTTTTAGIINLLKHSIERKRRTMEEQLLSESERVRKERKKRKMEQVLYNIHREQTGVVATGGTDTVSAEASGVGMNASTPVAFQHNLLAAASAAASSGACAGPVPPASPPLSVGVQDATSSLVVMEIVLQFMVAQQQETARRVHEEDERRRIQEEDRVRRRRLKDAQRRKDKHEMMLVMAALLQENFPVELRQYLDPSTIHVDADAMTTGSADGASSAKSRASPDSSIPGGGGDDTLL